MLVLSKLLSCLPKPVSSLRTGLVYHQEDADCSPAGSQQCLTQEETGLAVSRPFQLELLALSHFILEFVLPCGLREAGIQPRPQHFTDTPMSTRFSSL